MVHNYRLLLFKYKTKNECQGCSYKKKNTTEILRCQRVLYL